MSFSWHDQPSFDQIEEAYAEGLKRYDNARQRGRDGRYGNPNDSASREADGLSSVAEMQISHTTGRKWLSRGFIPDSGEDVEGISVRHTPRDKGRLLLHHGDKDDLISVLVVGEDRHNLSVRGWIDTAAGKNQDWWDDSEKMRNPCFAVPQDDLSLDPPPPLKRVDLPWEALVEVTGATVASERGALNAALKQIREASDKLTDEELAGEIRYRSKTYRETFPGMALTPTALAKHWERIPIEAPKPTYPSQKGGTSICATCEGDKLVLVATRPSANERSPYDEYAPCPDCNAGAKGDFWRADGTPFRLPDPALVRRMMNG
jgi:hypothetical protein